MQRASLWEYGGAVFGVCVCVCVCVGGGGGGREGALAPRIIVLQPFSLHIPDGL